MTIFVGDIAPKFFALRSPSEILIGSTRLLKPARVVLDPLSAMVERVSGFILRTVVPKSVKMKRPITQEELETLIEMREEQGALDEAEAAIIREILDVSAFSVRDCMVPRVNLPLLAVWTSPKKESPCSRRRIRVLSWSTGTRPMPCMVSSTSMRGASRAVRPSWGASGRLSSCRRRCPRWMHSISIWAARRAVCWSSMNTAGSKAWSARRRSWTGSSTTPRPAGRGRRIRELGQGRYLMDGATRLDHIGDELSITCPPRASTRSAGWPLPTSAICRSRASASPVDGIDIKVRRVSRSRVQQVELRLPDRKGKTEEDEA